MLEIEIDGKVVEVETGATVMDAANKAGVHIPNFCYHKKLSIAGNCRMCLVQVEKAPKPLPACATPVTGGMKVWTRSEQAIEAQKGVMEFLLINHPLDCPICDQGGECQLQDLAVGFGRSASRYQEEKRVVTEKELGSLIATDMTRCIHCTRCVRFGQEVASIMEMGQTGRGEHSEIMPFIGATIDSELSGNMIDLCPVGALTSKPFRYKARAWEMSRRRSVSPHDGLGANLIVQTMQDRVMRVLPLENEAVNECWLADRDRFSYEALNSEHRLTRPMIREGQGWREAEWSEALELVAGRLQSIRGRDGAETLGALASPHQTLEELYLLQKLMRALGSNNIDHRLAQSDFSADGKQAGVGWLGMPVVDIPHLDRILVIGSSLRKDHPLLAHRIRQAVRHRAQLCAINPVDDDWLTKVTAKLIVAPAAMVSALTEVALALAEAGATVDAKDQLSGVKVSDHARAIAASLMSGERKAVFLGNLAQHHPHYAQLHALAQSIAGASGAVLGILGEAANSVGAQVVKALPGAEGMNAGLMLDQPRKAYLLLGSEPELDAYDAQSAMGAMRAADFVVALSAYKHKAVDYAHVLLPIAPYTETAGSFISTEGRLQSFYGVVKPMGETRPAWKVLRVLGNLLGLEGFDFNGVEDVLREALPRGQDDVTASLDNTIAQIAITNAQAPNGLQRIGETPIYQLDPLVRRAPSLQKTTDAAEPAAWLPASLLAKLGVTEGDAVIVRQGNGMATLRAMPDERLPQNCVRVAAAHPLTAGLGARFGEITVEKA